MGGFGSQVEAGDEGGAGALALSLLATPLNPQILDELARGSRRLSELRHQVGSPTQAALRARLRQLGELGVVSGRRRTPFPGAREYELTGLPGRELLFVVRTVEDWLASAPDEPLDLASDAGQAAVAALAENWSGLVAARRSGDLRSRYEVTDWLRKGTGPIAAAARWERRHVPHEAAALTPVDAEVGFLLAMPLLRPAPNLAGSCRLGVEFGEGRDRLLAGVTVEVDDGRIVACTTRLETSPDAWAAGPAEAWLRTAIEADPNRLELGGNRRLVSGLIDALNQVLFGPARPLPSP